MAMDLKIKLYTTTVDCKNAYELAKFYAALLDWELPYYDEEYAVIAPPGANQGSYPGISFQQNDEYVPPVWPCTPDAQQQMTHLDFAVNNLEAAVKHAVACGATEANAQFSDSWRVMLDPAGHPFCLCLMPAVFDSPHFGLL